MGHVQYIEKFELFANANYIKDEKRVSVLLSLMGMRTYGLLHSLITPAEPGEMFFQHIVRVLDANLKVMGFSSPLGRMRELTAPRRAGWLTW